MGVASVRRSCCSTIGLFRCAEEIAADMLGLRSDLSRAVWTRGAARAAMDKLAADRDETC